MNDRREDLRVPWEAYIRGTLPEAKREQLERLLQSGDEDVFGHYLSALERCGALLPELRAEDSFSERIMDAIPEETREQRGRFGGKWTEPIVLYTMAAAAALLLTFTGAFDRLSEGAGHAAGEAGKVSYTEKLAESASSWLSGLKAKGDEHESTTK
ncbi:hypothetical protein QWJ34_07775 [Saccharibacillus sp. CPCC 101409]|uniref:hypothetical protein n=1 Tax=Saccharibacillus sp. CPCC 101409 TaxID=3058041 RepID=UPI002673254F|nr:hypothetical protein [Saccharibacillus sp. CPCC 101409]MDO3409659.1 hypothetical protein [Saccharibacillus sp. CPCC 101409]